MNTKGNFSRQSSRRYCSNECLYLLKCQQTLQAFVTTLQYLLIIDFKDVISSCQTLFLIQCDKFLSYFTYAIKNFVSI